jgi:hypothetical protein
MASQWGVNKFNLLASCRSCWQNIFQKKLPQGASKQLRKKQSLVRIPLTGEALGCQYSFAT